jgi:hypothetical protein
MIPICNVMNKYLFITIIFVVLGHFGTNGFTYFHCTPSCDINNMSKFSFYQHMTPHFAPNLPTTFYFGKIECVGNFQSLWDCRSEFELNWWTNFTSAELICPDFLKHSAITITECQINLSLTLSDEYQKIVKDFQKFKSEFAIFFCFLIFPYTFLWNIFTIVSTLNHYKYSLLENRVSSFAFVFLSSIKFAIIIAVYLYISSRNEENPYWLSMFRNDWTYLYKMCFFVYPVFCAAISVLRFEICLISTLKSLNKQKIV